MEQLRVISDELARAMIGCENCWYTYLTHCVSTKLPNARGGYDAARFPGEQAGKLPGQVSLPYFTQLATRLTFDSTIPRL